jgi:hypothetical protein
VKYAKVMNKTRIQKKKEKEIKKRKQAGGNHSGPDSISAPAC